MIISVFICYITTDLNVLNLDLTTTANSKGSAFIA